MQKRLTEQQRGALEGRYTQLRRAALEPGKVGNVVDAVSPDQADIKNVVEKIMSIMQTQDGLGKYHVAKAQVAALLKQAFEGAEELGAPHEQESPQEEEADLNNPVMHQVEDLEHEVQSMDDAKLMQEVNQLEHDMKQDLHQVAPEEGAPEGGPPALSAEHKLALLLSLPINARKVKAAKLRALAGVLDSDEREVSNDNSIDNTEKSDEALVNDYKDEEDGSMKDVGKVAALKNTLRQLIAASEDIDNEDDNKADDEDGMDKEAVLKLALKHLKASIDEEYGDDEPEEEHEEAEERDEPEEEKEEAKPFGLDERKAILKARLESLRRQANVDGRSMTTPKEVPSPSGTTEDNLKGDAKIQYSTATGDTSLDEIHDRRQKIPKDKQVAGNEEPNAVYQSNSPTKDRYEPTSETDSSKEVGNKRVLPDMGTAVQKAEPASPPDEMESGAGSHQKAKDWERAKNESDTTPSGDRLVGLAELVEVRTDRAVRLAGEMSKRGLITTEAQLREQIVTLASMNDEKFAAIQEVVSKTSIPTTTRPSRKANFEDENASIPPARDEMPRDDEEDEDNGRDEEPQFREARSVRRVSDSGETGSIRRTASKESSKGIRTALSLTTNEIASSGRSVIANQLAGITWTDSISRAEEAANLNEMFTGNTNPGLT